jgi:hypothetical protein
MRRNPTARECRVGQALADWLHDVGAAKLSEMNQGRGRWVTIWRTPFGCVLVGTLDNRVTAVSTQVPHGSPEELVEGLQAWASQSMECRERIPKPR